ncbi:MAG: Flp family type IVb pilin [Candidatus Tectimicrobiota bacterium]
MQYLSMVMLDEEGASTVEYAILLVGVAAVVVAAVSLLGGTVKGMFENVAPQVQIPS